MVGMCRAAVLIVRWMSSGVCDGLGWVTTGSRIAWCTTQVYWESLESLCTSRNAEVAKRLLLI